MTNNTEPNFEEFIGKTRKTSRIRWFAAAVIFVFFALLIFVSIDWVLGALVHTRQEVQVPDITQKPVTTALDSLATVNLALKQAGVEFAEGVPPGSVLRQIPSAGSTVREGRVIRVWISQGDEMVFVPSVEGLDLRAAQLAIRQAGLQVEKVENAFSLTVEKGLIISQKPKADSMLTRGDKVVLTLSNGQPPASVILVPDFSNKKSCYIKTAARFRAPEQPENHAYQKAFGRNPKHGSADPNIEAAAGPRTGIRKLSTV